MWPLRPWGFESPFSHQLLLSISLSLSLLACSQSPSESLQATFQAAGDGDFDAFRDGFTRRSGNFLAGLDAAAAQGHAAFSFHAMRGTPTILAEQPIGQVVVVQARLGNVTLPFPMVEERGRWRIDLRTAVELWYRFGSGPFAPALPDSPGRFGGPEVQ